ncbi:cytochrome P450 [Algoriphagus sp. AGSA1]|uniref:cytochrome P450 n=1 Tax=Algoriphagus sp. AGSA1 TaxID=2907213 RepID=UPI001F3BEC1E|nr:cytochrome P450 [Algoriphagus sp. AGSA1]MCE7056505.1 cytochrome P450 [Algoriphagus sp. AGSA1]
MTTIPKDKNIDSSLTLLRDGYEFIQKKRKKLGSNIFRTRLMLKKTICMSGREAAEVFYDNEKFQRKGATPKRVQKTLFGQKGVQTLDNSAHRQRKEMFMSLMKPDSLEQFLEIKKGYWETYISKWEKEEQIILFNEVQALLCRAVCSWSGVPLREEEVQQRAKDLGAMVDAFGAIGPRHWRGKQARKRAEKWIGNLIKEIRNGKIQVEKGTAAHSIAFHCELDGKLLDTKVAAVELLNVVRPTVAIATYITFTALALHQYPQYKKEIQTEKENLTEMLVQEVRRFYPFTPMVGAIVRKEFEWKGYTFKRGRLVLLDIYGMLHDPELWQHPQEFNPERFINWDGNPFTLIPQGGGEHLHGHRCAGEWLTIESMKQAVDFLTNRMTYEVPDQDLTFSLSRMPTLPRSGFMISKIKKLPYE